MNKFKELIKTVGSLMEKNAAKDEVEDLIKLASILSDLHSSVHYLAKAGQFVHEGNLELASNMENKSHQYMESAFQKTKTEPSKPLVKILSSELERLDGTSTGFTVRTPDPDSELLDLPEEAYVLVGDGWAAVWLTKEEAEKAVSVLKKQNKASQEDIWAALGGTTF